MPDITMCSGMDCPLKDKCFRYSAKPHDYQSYFRKPPFEIIHNRFTCNYFWGDGADLLFEQLTGIIKGNVRGKRRNKKSRGK